MRSLRHWPLVGAMLATAGPAVALVAQLATTTRATTALWASAIVGLTGLTLLVLHARRLRDAEARQRETLRTRELEYRTRTARIRETVSKSENAGRRLAAQIGDTLAGVARIASEAGSAHRSATELSDQVSHGASAMEEIQASVESLARQIANQNALIDQSAAAVEQMSASIDSVAAVARTKRASAEHLANLTRNGAATVTTAERLIDEVNESVDEVTGTIRVINTIAAQTNLLAMNAAIEAAHAGTYGRGFAVVAGEIRSLAETTAKNSTQISRTLSDLAHKIAEARTASSQSGTAFRTIQEEAESVSAAFAEISASTDELATGSNEIVEATEQLRSIASQTTTSAEEMRIGAGEVAAILTATRETSRDTAEAMELIEAAARTVSSASTTISTHSMENNTRVAELLRMLAGDEQESDSRASADAATQRLQIANMILSHMAWVGRLRTIVDGEPGAEAKFGEASECELGRWLEADARRVIDAPQVLERLKTSHDLLHESGRSIVGLRREGADPRDTEAEFSRLMNHARTVSEILASYEEGSFVWTPELSVSVETFDAHHQRLFALVSSLYRAMRDGAAGQALESVFGDLLDYTVYHFDAEEAAFAEYGYPQAEAHRARHAELIEKAQALHSDMQAGKPMVAVEVMQFLRDWITNHIQVDDKQYSDFFQGKPVDHLLSSTD